MRTWTPQNFLRRIQWWLEKSARQELHPADQAVEQLFFQTPYELILPWNFEELRRNPAQRFHIRQGATRPNGAMTLFMEALAPDFSTPTVAFVELTMPPIVQGFVQRDPSTLGALADILSGRGVEFLAKIQTELRERATESGTQALTSDIATVILLHIPVMRTEGAEPEKIYHRAFIVLSGAMRLGVATGALFEHERKYFNAAALVGASLPTEWRSELIFPMEVLYGNSVVSARQQSGISDAGPDGTLVGAGSLGSAILNLWGRCGWGEWSVIDADHIKPHNLTRHMAYSPHIGEPKSEVAAKLHSALMNGVQVRGICADACDLTVKVVSDATEKALVVDASAALEYPRLASTLDKAGRHISVFLTPSGNASVMLAEDAERLQRLRTLEAQYYRALIREEWGRNHLEGNGGTFWSGASCRDISMVMPYSSVLAHACILAEQVRLASLQPQAKIYIWERNNETSIVRMHDVAIHPERQLPFEGLTLYMDKEVEQKLRTMRADALPNETGGVLLGYYDFNVNTVVIVDALPPPADSKSTPHSFERGTEGLLEVISEALRRTARIVGYIGEWHSHPARYSTAPSRDDAIQLSYLAHGMSAEGLPAIQLIVGEKDMRVIKGTVA